MQDEEELSEDEIKKQEENNEYYLMKKAIKERNLDRFNSLKSKQDKEDDKIEEYMEDLNQEQKLKRQITNEKDSKKVVRGALNGRNLTITKVSPPLLKHL